MAEADPADQDEYFGELVGFLQDPKVSVQRLAVEGLLEQTQTIEFIAYSKRNPRLVAKQLLRLSERAEASVAKGAEGEAAEKGKQSGRPEVNAKRDALEAAESQAAGAAALKALVNLSAIPLVINELVDMNACRRCCEALRAGWLEGRSDLAHWYVMLLANLSTIEAGQKALCAEEAHLRFLFSSFVSKARPPPRDGYEDPMLCLGKVINNVCAREEGRAIFATGEASVSTMGNLSAELADRQRRPDIANAFRNLCLDKACHDAIVSTDLFARFARFIYPWEKASPEQRAELPEELQQVLLADGAVLTGDTSVRLAVANSIVGLCLTTLGRAYLRECGFNELIRAWTAEEADEDVQLSLKTAETCIDQVDIEEVPDAADSSVAPKTEGYGGADQPHKAAESES